MPLDRPSSLTRNEHTPTPVVARALSSTLLPPQLREAVPNCAKQCLSTYIAEEYKCSGNGFSCLCQTYSSAGFTLGELAYLCLHEDCSNATPSQSTALYDVCAAQTSAVLPTLSVLVAPTTTRLETSSATETQRSLSTISSATVPSSSRIKTFRASQTFHPASTRATSSTVASAAAAAATSRTASPHGLNNSQTVGIVVAALGGAVLLIAAVVLWIFLRRRKKRQDDRNETEKNSYDFIDKRPSVSPPARPIYDLLAREPTLPQPLGVPMNHGDANQTWQLPSAEHPLQVDEQPTNLPRSEQGQPDPRALSLLLPKNATMALSPKPQQVRARTDNASDLLPREVRSITAPRFNGFGLPPNPRAIQNSPAYQQPMQRPQPSAVLPEQLSPNVRPPPLSLDIPRSAARPVPRPPLKSPMRSPGIRAPLPNAGAIPSTRPQRGAPSPRALQAHADTGGEGCVYEQSAWTPLGSRSRDSFLNYYASPEAGVTTPPIPIEGRPSQSRGVSHGRRAAPSKIKIPDSSSLRPIAQRESAGSDTSFESTDLEEPARPHKDHKKFSAGRDRSFAQSSSPIADLRYPKIPRSTNQTIPQSLPSMLASPTNQQSSSNRTLPKPSPHVYRAYSPNPQKQEEEWPLKSPVTPIRPINTASPSLSGSTLAAKRRGSSAAQSLDLRLEIPGTNFVPAKAVSKPLEHRKERSRNAQKVNYRDHPSVGHGQAVRNSPRSLKVTSNTAQYTPHSLPPRKSSFEDPGWRSKMTPEKRGDDLFLQVGVATPMNTTFDV
ncbi:hypothetical protein BDY17DRAFT_292011 [Neohortaea acidophila]|uniref:CFEM domain-containing protein n=1 Tax=Neohortaea acidophila TaxID=245834 RepID=A0A6A6Q387_9PEZI|nr:uncharacterized protein BDY17DRAFT_292011 [Neohortaea acidophila]KAF2486732.1 hypothetical protein BDY17DRAFT_292011 [Neohortaea acidophila]